LFANRFLDSINTLFWYLSINAIDCSWGVLITVVFLFNKYVISAQMVTVHFNPQKSTDFRSEKYWKVGK
jgi:hypothetical protein